MKFKILSLTSAFASLLATSGYAITTEDRLVKVNYIVEYLKIPGEAESLQEMFTKGEVYGRLRSNNFMYDYDDPKANTPSMQDHEKFALGGSLTYKTAFYNRFGATAGVYGTVPLGGDNEEAGINYTKTAKDVYRTRADGSEAPIGVLAVAYGEYKRPCLDVTIGRQIIETALLGSNDSKMIPNTFEAALAKLYVLPQTTLQLGYVTAQKLRDHHDFHSIIAYAPRDENDDGNNHKGLNVANLQTAGKEVDPAMILLSAENKSINNLRLYSEYGAISGYFSTLLLEGGYGVGVGGDWKLTPTIRYIRQFDDGAGAVGGAALSGKFGLDQTPSVAAEDSYTNTKSVDAQLYAGKLALSNGIATMLAGYSHTADQGDIINPWRAFPTRSYNRAMAQNNWYANTDSWMIEGDYNFGKAQMIPGLWCNVRYSEINIDDRKSAVGTVAVTDRKIWYFHAIEVFKALPNTEFRFRFADVDAKRNVLAHVDDSYQEYRLEMNYLF
jgi:hypothetical protein